MFNLFYQLYLAMFTGVWDGTASYNSSQTRLGLNLLGTLATSIFGDNQMTNLGNDFTGCIIPITSLILALITSIGIVVMAVKGIKKVFGVFFMGLR